jgi:WD40 repeat protein
MARMGSGICILVLTAIVFAAPVADRKDERSSRERESAQDDLALLQRWAADPNRYREEVWRSWQQFRWRHAGTPEWVEANELMSRVRSPLDQFSRKGLSQEALSDHRIASLKGLVAVLGEHRGWSWYPILHLAVSPDGKWLATPERDCVRLWDAATLQEMGSYDIDIAGLNWLGTLAFDRSSRLLAVATGKRVRLLNLSTPTALRHVATLEGHTEKVASLAFAQDGRLLSSAFTSSSADTKPVWPPPGEAFIWHVSPERPGALRRLKIYRDGPAVCAEALSPEGSWLVAEDAQKRPRVCRLWPLSERGEGAPFTLKDIRAPFAFSRDGKWLATQKDGGGLIVWDLSGATPKERHSFGPLAWGSHRAFAFSPDSTVLASVASDKRIRLWPLSKGARQALDVQPGEEVRVLAEQTESTCLVFYPDGKALAVGGDDQRIRVLEVPSGRDRFPPRGHRGPVRTLAVSSDCRRLVSGDHSGDLRFWDLSGGRASKTGVLPGREVEQPGIPYPSWPEIDQLDYSPDGNFLFGLADQPPLPSQVQVWDLRHGLPSRSSVHCSDTSPGRWIHFLVGLRGDRVVTTGEEDNDKREEVTDPDGIPVIHLWDWRDGTMTLRDTIRPGARPSPQHQIMHAALSPNERLLALSLYGGKECQLWDVAHQPARRLAQTKVARPEWESFGPLVFTPDSRHLVTTAHEWDGDEEGCFQGLAIRTWDVTGEKLRQVRHFRDGGWYDLPAVDLSPDGTLLAGRDGIGRLSVWRLASGEQMWSAKLPGPCLFRFAPDSRHLITGNANGTLYVIRLIALKTPPP